MCLQGVKVWCDGKEVTSRKAGPSGNATEAAGGPDEPGPCNKVLLPFARQDCNTSLVVAAEVASPPPPAAAAASKQCVVLVRDFRCVDDRICTLYVHSQQVGPEAKVSASSCCATFASVDGLQDTCQHHRCNFTGCTFFQHTHSRQFAL